jgi:Flp pilus assembly protein TadG
LKSERGSSVVELAIVFPILLMLFVGAAELGRLFYTYTTLAKATKVGARYLTTQIEAESTDPTVTNPLRTRVANLVVCGYTDGCTGDQPDGTPKRAVVPGLMASNVLVTLPLASTLGPRYVKVEITGYSFPPGVFNLGGATGISSTAFYFALEPATRMRYMH